MFARFCYCTRSTTDPPIISLTAPHKNYNITISPYNNTHTYTHNTSSLGGRRARADRTFLQPKWNVSTHRIETTDLLVDPATAAAAAAAAGGDSGLAHHHTLTNGSIVDAKTGQTVLTAGSAAAKSHFSSIGALHLTQEECNEILIKRAIAAGHHQTHTITAADGSHHHASGGTPSKHLKSVFVTPDPVPPATYSSTHYTLQSDLIPDWSNPTGKYPAYWYILGSGCFYLVAWLRCNHSFCHCLVGLTLF